jgi:hypothetical protein
MPKASMDNHGSKPVRDLLCALLIGILAPACGLTAAQAQSEPLRIGIIGTGNIGGALARHWARAGHELVISSRHPGELEALAEELGPKVRAAAPAEAARFGAAVLEKGTGIASAEFLPGARLVRAFNCIPAWSLANRANRKPDRIAIPIAGDDPGALAVARRLVEDAGFDAVVVGPLRRAGSFDLGHALAAGNLTAGELQRLVDERW